MLLLELLFAASFAPLLTNAVNSALDTLFLSSQVWTRRKQILLSNSNCVDIDETDGDDELELAHANTTGTSSPIMCLAKGREGKTTRSFEKNWREREIGLRTGSREVERERERASFFVTSDGTKVVAIFWSLHGEVGVSELESELESESESDASSEGKSCSNTKSTASVLEGGGFKADELWCWLKSLPLGKCSVIRTGENRSTTLIDSEDVE